MPCHWIDLGNGVTAHVRTGKSKPRRCGFCNNRYVTKLCDFPVGNSKTCDAGMCDQCAKNIANEVDYCPRHHNQTPPTREYGY